MLRIAIKMLLGDKAKYLGLIFGVAFATLLMSQQVSIFIGIMARTASSVYNISEADVWVMDPRVLYVEEIESMRPIELTNVRSVPGIAWAVPLFKGLVTIRMPDGVSQVVQMLGVDDVSLVGLCDKMVVGDRESLRVPQNAILDDNGFIFMWPNEKPHPGKMLEVNDHRLKISGVCDLMPNFTTWPIMTVTYDTAMEITPPVRNKLSFILVKAAPGVNPKQLAQRITQQTGLQALVQHDFAWRSIMYMLTRTGIALNFGITILLGVIIGSAITAQTFYIFVVENLKQFGAMKAIGVTNGQLLHMVMLQATIVMLVGFSIGISFTGLFMHITKDLPSFKGFALYWQVIAGTFAVMAMVIFSSIIFSLRRVFKVDPAIVFRG